MKAAGWGALLVLAACGGGGGGGDTDTAAETGADLATDLAEDGGRDASDDVPVVPPVPGEWTQHGHDAQRTSFATEAPPLPWRWAWSWNGPDASGAVASGKTSLPRGVQPVTGGGRVYVARGPDGVTALGEADGAELWTATPGGEFLGTLAADPDGAGVWAGATDGRLRLLAAADGAVLATFDAGDPIRTAPCLFDDLVVVTAGSRILAVDRAGAVLRWAYDAGSELQTPASYSPSRGVVVAGSADLRVHAVRVADGSAAWTTKPTVHDGGEPYEYLHGWPVVAEAHGLVFVKLRLDWATLWTWNPWPADNAALRANLADRPDQQALFALDLDDGSVPFTTLVGHGGYGDGDYMPMGPQPVVRRLADGTEVLYTIIRGDADHDARWDSHFGEVVLDDATVPGLAAGDVRWIDYDYPFGAARHYLLTDEQPNVSMAGDLLFGAHWEAGLSLRITDRSAARGTYDDPIRSENAPTVVSSQDGAACPFSAGHFCPAGLENTRVYSPGFYIFHGQGAVYDEYWSTYAAWVVSLGRVYFRSCDGSLAALEPGAPAGKSGEYAPAEHGPAATPADEEPLALRAEDARRHAGRLARVTGRLADVFDNGKALYLGFRRPHRGGFLVRIPRDAWSRFPAAPAELFRTGQLVEVTGRIDWYQGDPQIRLDDPHAIRLVADPLGGDEEDEP